MEDAAATAMSAAGQMPTPMAPKQFLSVENGEDRNKLRLNEEIVNSLLLTEDVADKPVVVISVAGASRTGKSFLLNLMSRYLMASDKTHWLDDTRKSFHWESGCEPDTNGMFMSHPIPVTLQSGQEAVLLLMDTQGSFSRSSDTDDSTRIFALSTLLSSVQVYNVKDILQNDALDNLQLFTEFGRMAMNNTEWRVFQNLVFLIRDWCYTQNYSIGRQGGNKYVQNQLRGSNRNNAQGRAIRECFTDVSGFLLPHPGPDVAGSPTFEGDAEDMDPAFSRALEELMPTLLSPEKLTVKMNGDRPMTCRQLVTHIKTYTKLFLSDELPKAMSILQACASAGNMAAVNDDFHDYEKRMEKLLYQDTQMFMKDDGSVLYIGDNQEMAQKSSKLKEIMREHEQAKTEALRSFSKRRLIKDPNEAVNYTDLLEKKIDEWFKGAENCMKANKQIVEECKAFFQKCTTRSRLNPLSYLPSREATVIQKHERSQQEALQKFDNMKITVGTYDAEESRKEIEFTGDLHKALKKNQTVQFYWKVVGGVIAVGVTGSAIYYFATPELAIKAIQAAIQNLRNPENATAALQIMLEGQYELAGMQFLTYACTSIISLVFMSRSTQTA